MRFGRPIEAGVALGRLLGLPSDDAEPLGRVKGAGEAGATAATAAILSAATDALKELGVKDLSIPLTPERVWRAIRSTRSRSE